MTDDDKDRKSTATHPSGQRSQRCGTLWGDLSALLPFVYIATPGLARSFGHSEFGVDERGFFTLGETDDHAKRAFWHSGVILPFSHCHDPDIRALGPAILRDCAAVSGDTLRDRRQRGRRVLTKGAGGPLQLADGSDVSGFLTLRVSPQLFPYLHAYFDYVTEVMVAPDGKITTTQTARFPWASYGALIEWRYWLNQPTAYRALTAMIPHIVIDADAICRNDVSQMFRTTKVRTDENPAKWFAIRADVKDAAFGIQFVMHEWGWAELFLTIDEQVFQIDLSNVYDPFFDLLDWGREVGEGELPAVVEIDEEGQHTRLTALPTDDPARILLRVSHPYLNRIAGEAIVLRQQFGEAFQAELHRFFTDAFDPEHWNGDQGDEDHLLTREKALAHPWLAALVKSVALRLP